MQQSLPLSTPTVQVTFAAVIDHLGNMAAHGFPAGDLASVVITTPAHVVATIPLEPPARVIGMDPSLLTPIRQWLRRTDAEVVDGRVIAYWRELGFGEWKFLPV
jgi:hypothetical protein